jgi:uncharacterized protein YjdB
MFTKKEYGMNPKTRLPLYAGMICALMFLGACKDLLGDGGETSVTAVVVTPANPSVEVGATVQLQAAISPGNATNKTVTWTSSAPAIAAVSNTGLVSAYAVGSTVITAASVDGPSGTTTVTVVPLTVPLESISLNQSSLNLVTGTTGTLTVIYNPTTTTQQGVSWSSSNPAVATVDSSTGLITAAAVGTATITAASTANSSKTASCVVSVTASVVPITGISLSQPSLNLLTGTTGTLTVIYNPTTTTQQGVSWSSNDPAVATVDSSTGLITAVGGGAATITATSTTDGSIKATATVNVTVPITGLSLNPATLDLTKGNTAALTPAFTPVNTTQTGLNWTSSNPAVVTVSGGTVTAVGGGTATITATSTTDGSIKATATVNVTVPLTGISIPSTLTLGNGSSSSLLVTYTPATTTQQGVTWSSSAPTVATVSDGTVTAVSPGTATITATSTANNSIQATCNITVQPTFTGAGINVVFEGLEDEDITLNTTLNQWNDLIITAPASFNRYLWYMDGSFRGTTFSPTFQLSSLSVGHHYLTVIVEKADGSHFSKTLTYTVGY